MPIYTYSCNDCNVVVEKRQSFTDEPLTTCEQCGGSLRKVIHPVGIVFKGSGWYVNDSRSSTQAATSAPKPAESTESGSNGGSSESKSKPKPEAEASKSSEPATPSKAAS